MIHSILVVKLSIAAVACIAHDFSINFSDTSIQLPNIFKSLNAKRKMDHLIFKSVFIAVYVAHSVLMKSINFW